MIIFKGESACRFSNTPTALPYVMFIIFIIPDKFFPVNHALRLLQVNLLFYRSLFAYRLLHRSTRADLLFQPFFPDFKSSAIFIGLQSVRFDHIDFLK